jgi:hypothetical protein
VFPGYENRVHVAGKDVTLSEKEADRYKELLLEEYGKKMKQMRTYDNPDREDVHFSHLMNTAKQHAKSRLLQEIREASGEPKRKRFTVFQP